MVGNYSYFWENIGNGATQQVQPLKDSIFRVILSDGCSPWDTAQVVVTIAEPLSVIATGDTLICPDRTIAMKAYGKGGVASTYQYTWSHGLGQGTAKQIVAYTEEDYIVTLTDNCSFAAYDTVTVRHAALPDVNFTVDNDTGCQPLVVNFTSNHNDAGGFSNWQWLYESRAIANTAVNQSTHTFEKPGLFPTQLIVTSSYGCVDTSATVDVLVHPKPAAIFEFSPEVTTIVEPTVTMKIGRAHV